MSKSTSFSTDFGYIRHPEDRDHICFWCGNDVKNTWDYTPHRHIARSSELMAKLEQPYAVQACTRCINKTTYRKTELLTIQTKRDFFNVWMRQRTDRFAKIEKAVDPEWKMWQVKLADGSLADMPEYLLNDLQRAMKLEYYKSSALDGGREDSGASNRASGIVNPTSDADHSTKSIETAPPATPPEQNHVSMKDDKTILGF